MAARNAMASGSPGSPVLLESLESISSGISGALMLGYAVHPGRRGRGTIANAAEFAEGVLVSAGAVRVGGPTAIDDEYGTGGGRGDIDAGLKHTQLAVQPHRVGRSDQLLNVPATETRSPSVVG